VVDVEAILKGLAAKNAQKLNWQTSIVDLMKLLGLDSSLQNRTALAKELGYSGDTDVRIVSGTIGRSATDGRLICDPRSELPRAGGWLADPNAVAAPRKIVEQS
jgi:hypothetical protein